MGDASKDATLTKNEQEAKLTFGHGVQKGFDKENDSKKTVPFYKLFSFADSTDKLLMTLGGIGAISNGLARPLMTVLLGEFIDVFGLSQSNETLSHMLKVPVKFVYLAFGCGVGALLQVSCWMITGERQAARLRSAYLKSILRQEIAYFDLEISTGEVIERINGDTFIFQNAIGEKVGTFIQVLATVFGGIAIAFVKGWLLSLVMLSSFPMIFMFRRVMNFLNQKKVVQSQTTNANMAKLVQQTLGSIRTVASFTGEKQALTKYKRFLTDAYKCDTYIAMNNGLEAGILHFLFLSNVSLGVWFGASMILHKGYTPGQVFTVIIAIVLGTSYTSVRQAYPSIIAFAACQVAAFKMFEVINRNPTIDAYYTKGRILDDIRGDIELRNISFSYPSRPKEPILDGFSLFISHGTTTALIGQSGSGKSTVISLIERFYDPQFGEVLIDGINLKDFQLKWIRSKISLVNQEPVLFTSTIKDNVAYGKDGATLEEIKGAIMLAKADDFINELPQGLDTMVGEHGIQLSGGQKQRVAIARAIIKNPRILLLDEATSALDTKSERMVQEALENIRTNRTTVVVAHRLSTIRNADTIAILHRGKIIEKGTHSELLKDPKGVYSTLISSQEVSEVLQQSHECDSDTGIDFGAQSSRRISATHCSNLDSCDIRSVTSCSESVSILTSTITNGKDKSLEEPKESQDVSIFWLAGLNKPEVPVLIVASIFAIIVGASPPVYAFLISSSINSFYEEPHKLKKDSEFWALMLFILGVVSIISNPLKGYLFGIAGNKLIHRIRLKCFEKVINMEIGWFDDPQNSSGVIGARLSNDATKVRVLVGDAVADLVQVVSAIAIGLTISFKASWQLSLIILTMMPLIMFNVYVQMKSMKGFCNDAKVRYEEASQVAKDAIGNIRTVTSFCAQDTILEIYKKKYQTPVATETKQGLISGIGFGISICLLYSVLAIIFYAGSRFVQNKRITASDVFQVYYALNTVSFAIYSSTTLVTDSNEAKRAATSIFALLNRESEINSADESSGITLDNITGQIEFKHVKFSYPTRLDVQVLRDLSLIIQSGKVIALVGESGSGKSTVISLLQRFYNPDSGHITLDGIDISKFQLKWLRQQMGLVSQEPVLFENTIRANIACGKEESATEAEIMAAAKLANAHEFISSLQEGYETVVGERGVQLSGGQKQRVAIARAIVKSPRILLLDEATSALDVESEKVVQRALDSVMLNKTTIVVAHRLSTIKRADVIAVFKSGSIMEKGNHDTLIDMKEGLYSSLVKLRTAAL